MSLLQPAENKKLNRAFLQGYNGTVLAYGQTGSGKTHTMSGGVGHYGVKERGVTPRVIDHVFAHVAAIGKRLKPGEKIEVSASAVEIYNEEFRDLSKTSKISGQRSGWDSVRTSGQAKELKLQVRCLATQLPCHDRQIRDTYSAERCGRPAQPLVCTVGFGTGTLYLCTCALRLPAPGCQWCRIWQMHRSHCTTTACLWLVCYDAILR